MFFSPVGEGPQFWGSTAWNRGPPVAVATHKKHARASRIGRMATSIGPEHVGVEPAAWIEALFGGIGACSSGAGCCEQAEEPVLVRAIQRDRETEREREKERKRRTDRQTEQSVCAAWTPHAISSRSRTYWASQTPDRLPVHTSIPYCNPDVIRAGV